MRNRRFFWLVAAVLVSFHVVALLADFLAPYGFDEQHRLLPFAAPARPSAAVRFFVHGYPYRLLGLFTCDRHLFGVDPPATFFLLGSDGFGRARASAAGRGRSGFVEVRLLSHIAAGPQRQKAPDGPQTGLVLALTALAQHLQRC